MSQNQRAFTFDGSDEDYISFLENELLAALRGVSTQIINGSIISPSGFSSTSLSDHQPRISSTASSHPQCSDLSTLSPDPQPNPSATVSADPPPSDCRETCSSFRASYPTSSCSTRSPPSSAQGDLQIIYYDPISNSDGDLPGNATSTLPAFKQTRIVETQAMKELRHFVGYITGKNTWVKKKEELGLCCPGTNKATIEALCGQSLSPELCKVPQFYPEQYPPEYQALVSRVCGYGALTKESKLQGNLLLHISKYQQLIFVSLCVVMLKTGIPIEVVNWTMRQYVSDTKNDNLRRLRSGSLWANRCVSRLLNKNWGFRSWEVFLLFPRNIQQYGRFANSKDSCDSFVADMGTPEQPLPPEEDGFIPYCIPCIIKLIAGQDLKLVDICNILDYNILIVSQIYENYYSPPVVDFNPFTYVANQDAVDFNPFSYSNAEYP